MLKHQQSTTKVPSLCTDNVDTIFTAIQRKYEDVIIWKRCVLSVLNKVHAALAEHGLVLYEINEDHKDISYEVYSTNGQTIGRINSSLFLMNVGFFWNVGGTPTNEEFLPLPANEESLTRIIDNFVSSCILNIDLALQETNELLSA